MKQLLSNLGDLLLLAAVDLVLRLGLISQEYPPVRGPPRPEVYANPFEPLFEIKTHRDVAALGCLLGAPLRRGQA